MSPIATTELWQWNLPRLRAAALLALGIVWVPTSGTAGDVEDGVPFDSVQTFEVDDRVHRAAVRFYRSERLAFVQIRPSGGDRWTGPVRRLWGVEIGDVDGDSDDELLYGVWVAKDDDGDFPAEPRKTVWVMEWSDGRVDPKWRGSRLSAPIGTFEVRDVDADDREELVVHPRTSDGSPSTHEWCGFGFRRVDGP